MAEKRTLVILEVSQKQAYIFASNKLKDNILNSAVIAYVLHPRYIKKVLESEPDVIAFDVEKNLVSSGGGNTILEFEDKEKAKKAVQKITETIYREFDGLTVFAKVEECEETDLQTDFAKVLDNLKKKLETKKSVRKAAFHQGTYGIEKTDTETMNAYEVKEDSEEKDKVRDKEKEETANEFCPSGYDAVTEFARLGGDKGESNFIAVVHVDGNAMGKRVNELYEKLKEKGYDWETVKKKLQAFSKGIDKDFKDAFKKMTEEVGESLKDGSLKGRLSLDGRNFPVRRVITAGDDICYVTEGRIGIETARIFIEKLINKVNEVQRDEEMDHANYAACAGVAIVHQKYPFYRAYELAESLCSEAKKYGASICSGEKEGAASCIDWHIEFGELKDTVGEIRKDYVTVDQNYLHLRPYIVRVPSDISCNVAKQYSYFRRTICAILDNEENYGTGKIKGLRDALKKGETASGNYIRFNRMEELLKDKSAFTNVDDRTDNEDKKRSFLFDAIELMDTYLPIEKGAGANDE